MYKTLDEEKTELIQRFLLLFAGIIVLLFIGTLFFHFTEGWTLKNSLYYSGISLTSRGFSDTFPQTWPGIAFSITYTLIGVGFVIYAFSNLIAYYISYYQKRVEGTLTKVFNRIKKKEKKPDKWIDFESIKNKFRD